MSSPTKVLIHAVTEALETVAREIPKGLAAAHHHMEEALHRAAHEIDRVEQRLAHDAAVVGHEAKKVADSQKNKVKALRGTMDLGLPGWVHGGRIPASGPESRLFRHDYDRYGGMDPDDYLVKHWDADARPPTWRYPPHHGFDGPALPNTMKPGTVIDRFGSGRGEFASPAGTPFEQRALPPSSVGQEYHRYVVRKPLPKGVKEGFVAPAFEQPGGGVQFQFDLPIQWYVDHHYLEEIT